MSEKAESGHGGAKRAVFPPSGRRPACVLSASLARTVISGHNHRHHLLPATEQFPYAQLLGGGNRPNNATVITGEADANGLILTCSGLDGAKRYELPLKPLR